MATTRRNADFPCRFTLDEVSGLDRDASTALAIIHEWKNSFVPINRVPLDVLSLIPTHLPSQNDRFRATFVCRHWRRAFLQNATLWSRLCLSKGEAYAKTLLKRAKNSPLSILVGGADPVGTVMLLLPHITQIAELKFTNNRWVDILRLSDLDSGPLPLLRTLDIDVIWGIDPNSANVVISPSRPLFSGAVDLKELRLHLEEPPFLNHFIFPNLTSFELSVTSEEQFHGSQLLDFLEASPMLQVVDVKIFMALSLEGVTREKVVVLQHVENLCLAASDGYKLATHISCPSVKNTSLMYLGEGGPYNDPPPETFPASDPLNAIIRQYTRSPIEEVTLDITGPDYFVACSLTFRSADATVIKFRFKIDEGDEIPETFSYDVFSEACRAIRNLPRLTDIKRLHIDGLDVDGEPITLIAHEFGHILKSLGPLEELAIRSCDLRPYFLYYPGIVGYPPIRVLTLTDLWGTLSGDTLKGLVKLVEAQHELGVPFECVTIRSCGFLAGVEERLRPWVGAANYALYDGF